MTNTASRLPQSSDYPFGPGAVHAVLCESRDHKYAGELVVTVTVGNNLYARSFTLTRDAAHELVDAVADALFDSINH